MIDESLVDIVESWDEFSWFDRKRIWWKCIKHKHKINGKQVVSLATAISIAIVLNCEQCPSITTGLLVTIVLLYFYIILVDYLIHTGKTA